MRWAVFISGTGSNLTALLDAYESWDIRVVVTNKATAPGAARSRRRGVPVWKISKNDSWVTLSDRLKAAGVQAIALAGFMKIIPAEFLNHWDRVVINLHPSLLPLYPGLNSLKRAFDDGASIGITVHHVVSEVDAGPIVVQKALTLGVEFSETETRAHILEQRLLQKGVGICDRKL